MATRTQSLSRDLAQKFESDPLSRGGGGTARPSPGTAAPPSARPVPSLVNTSGSRIQVYASRVPLAAAEEEEEIDASDAELIEEGEIIGEEPVEEEGENPTAIYRPNEEAVLEGDDVDTEEQEEQATSIWQGTPPSELQAAAPAPAPRAAAPAPRPQGRAAPAARSGARPAPAAQPVPGVATLAPPRSVDHDDAAEKTIVTDAAFSAVASQPARPQALPARGAMGAWTPRGAPPDAPPEPSPVWVESAAPQSGWPGPAAPGPAAARPRSVQTIVLATVGLIAVAVIAFVVARSFREPAGASGAAGTGTVAVFTNPPGATILLDGVAQAQQTPTTLSGLVPGRTYTIGAELSGYRPALRTVTLDAGGLSQETLTLEAAVGELAIVTNPPGAAVTVNGTARGVSPITIPDLDTAQAYAISATLAGYAPATETVRWDSSSATRQSVTMTLVPAAGGTLVATGPTAPALGGELGAPGTPPAIPGAVPAPAEGTGAGSPPSVSPPVTGQTNGVPETRNDPEPRERPSGRGEETAPDRPRERPSGRGEESAPDRPRERPSGRGEEGTPDRPRERPSGRGDGGSSTREEEPAGEGSISVQAVPYGQVWIDGRMVSSETPLMNHELSAGTHRVKVYFVSLRDFSDERTVRIEAGQNRTITFRAQQ